MPTCKEVGCSREAAPGSEYCQICGQDHKGAPKSLEENTALVKRIAGKRRQQPFGLLGTKSGVELPGIDTHPYQQTPGERFSRFGGVVVFLMGLVVIAAILIGVFVMIYTGGRSAAETVLVQQNKSSSSSSTRANTPVYQPDRGSVIDYDKLKFRIRATPKSTGISPVSFLNVRCNEAGSVWVNVEGISNYRVKWRVKRLQWSMVNSEEIRVWSPTEINFTGTIRNEAGRNLITAELYDSNDDLISEEKLSVRVR